MYWKTIDHCIDTICLLFRNDEQSLGKELSSLLRRLYRLYLHTFYNHLDGFCEEERKTHLYEKFYSFAWNSSLLTLKEMKPHLSDSEMREYVYGN